MPWGYIEHLKLEDRDGPKASKIPLPVTGARMYCYNDNSNFMPEGPAGLFNVFFKSKES